MIDAYRGACDDAGKEPGEIILQTGFSWAEDDDAALEGARVWKATQPPEFFTDDWSVPAEMYAHAEEQVSDEEFKESYIISSDPDHHAERIREVEELGATVVCLQNGSGADPLGALRVYGERVLPSPARRARLGQSAEVKAVVGTPGGPRRTELREVAEPEPGPGEALVAVRAFAPNRGELRLLAARDEGWQPGQDVAGDVIRAAADGSGPQEGERVAGLADWHGWAERAAVPAHRLASIPEGVDYATAAALPMAGTTAANLVRRGGSLLGSRVLVTGASGGVGHLAVQLAELAGATVDGVSTATKAPGDGYHLILESAGGASLAAAVDTVAHDGRIVVFGNSAGEPGDVDFRAFAGREASGRVVLLRPARARGRSEPRDPARTRRRRPAAGGGRPRGELDGAQRRARRARRPSRARQGRAARGLGRHLLDIDLVLEAALGGRAGRRERWIAPDPDLHLVHSGRQPAEEGRRRG